MRERIEAITVCVNYADFLYETAKINRGLFDHWIIVTEAADMATREVCRKFNLSCLLSEDAKRHGKDSFNKGLLIERGLKHLSDQGWRLHIDADIALPNDFRQRLESAHLHEHTIYGVDRLMVRSFEAWKKLHASGYLNGGQYDYFCRTNAHREFELGTRWCHPSQGFVPIGFFQLWHSSEDEWRGVRTKPYPSRHGTACRTDVQHALQWDRRNRSLIPEIFAVHLESEIAKMGANWNGRTTVQFGNINPRTGTSDDGAFD